MHGETLKSQMHLSSIALCISCTAPYVSAPEAVFRGLC